MTNPSFNLAQSDQNLIANTSIALSNVDDVGSHPGVVIKFQFPPIVKSDSKSLKWKEIMNTVGYEPEYMYEGGKPRKISIEATYIVGGPSGKWGISDVTREIRTWKKYFYFGKFAGGGAAAGKDLPIYRIVWGDFLAPFGQNSSWRAKDYNVKYSDTWILDGNDSHPLISTITVSMELATQVRVSKSEPPKQDHPNLQQFAPPEWY
jgi:hypothetical protein